jgi:citrate lyase synthetase
MNNNVVHATWNGQCILYTVLVPLIYFSCSTKLLMFTSKITFNIFFSVLSFTKIMNIDNPSNMAKKTRNKNKRTIKKYERQTYLPVSKQC